MFKIFFEQFALIGALSTVVLAALWPHAKLIVVPILSRLFNALTSDQSGNNHNNHDCARSILDKRPIEEHPRLGGHSLRRMVSQKETITSTAYSSFAGYGQSQFANDPRFLSSRQTGHHRASASDAIREGTIHPPFGQSTQSKPNGIQSMSFALIVACVMGLIMFVIMKLLTSRFGKSNEASRDSNFRTNKPRGYGQTRDTITDLRQDNRKLARLSRDERARQLILHHGSKNVSRAMKFLIDELRKQKQRLLADSQINITDPTGETETISRPCSCSCHPKF